MAPLPQNNTARVFFDYITGNQPSSTEHTVAWRSTGPGTTNADVQNTFLGFLQALGAGTLMAGWRVLRVRVQEQGQNFSLPVPVVAGLAAFVGTNASTYPQNREAEEWVWSGRSATSGRRVDFSLYGLAPLVPANFRFPVGGSSPAWVAGTVNYLNGTSAPVGPLVIDFTEPTWYQYVNVQYNSYWEERIRRG